MCGRNGILKKLFFTRLCYPKVEPVKCFKIFLNQTNMRRSNPFVTYQQLDIKSLPVAIFNIFSRCQENILDVSMRKNLILIRYKSIGTSHVWFRKILKHLEGSTFGWIPLFFTYFFFHEQLKESDAIFLGAVGYPGRVPGFLFVCVCVCFFCLPTSYRYI
jgi:hypothetical protein